MCALIRTEGKQSRQRPGSLESRWTEVQGLAVHARVSVDAVLSGTPAVVLVHGLGVSSRYMVPTARQLAPQYRVYAPDLPGFGKSAKPSHVLNIAELTDALVAWMGSVGLDRAVMLGNSMGCQIIADCAVRYPKCVERAVLVGPTMDSHGRTALRHAWRLLRDTPREAPSQPFVVAADYLQAGLLRAWCTLQYALADRIEEKLPHVRVPVLVVRGEHDPIVPQRWAAEVARLLPRSRLVVIPGGAHTVNYSSPLELVRVVRPFLSDGDST
jgi:pimeloyl-ACP methyl ester carboxylesterase